MALNPTDFIVSLSPNPLKIVLGMTGTASMQFSNISATERGYNLTATMTIPDGASFVSSSVIPTSIITNPDSTITVSWINIKDLAPNEVNYGINVTLQADELFRSTGLPVPFDVPLSTPLDMSGTVDTLPRGNDDPGNIQITKNASVSFIPARYNLTKQAPGKIPRGAGKLSPVTSPLWPYQYTLTLMNNTRTASTVTLVDSLPNGVRYLNNLSVSGPDSAALSTPTVTIPSPSPGCLDYVSINWGSVTLSAGSVNVITFTAAVWDRFTAGCQENSGTIIPHGTPMTNSATLDGLSGPIQATATTTALDALINKSVSPEVTDVGVINHYTLSYEINQYANVGSIIITDIVSDGQSYNLGSASLPPQSVTVNPDGTTTIIWNLGLLATGTTGTITFTTTVNPNYVPHNPVSSADTLTNGVTIDGINQTTSQLTPDHSGAATSIPIPAITKELLQYYYQDGITPKGYSVAAPGDQVEFRITYSSIGIEADQLDIEIDEYAPVNMGPLTAALPVTYGGTLGTSFFPFTVSPNGLRWLLGTVPGNSLWTATFKVPVQNLVFVGKRNNLAKLAGRDTPGFSYSDRSQVEVTFGQPNVTFGKTVSGPDPNAIKAGEIYTYTITIANPQNADHTVTDAFFMNLTDIIPAGLIYAGTYNVSGSGSYTTPQFTGQNVSMTVTKLAPGDTLTFTYDVLVTNLVVSGQTYTNHAVLQSPHSQPDPASFQYPGGPYTAQAVLKAQGLIVSKLAAPPSAQIGDVINYIVQITVPLGTTAYNIRGTDTFPAGTQVYIVGSLKKDGVPVAPLSVGPGTISFQPIPFIDATAAAVTVIYAFDVRVTNGVHAFPYSDPQTDSVTVPWDLDQFGTPAIPASASAILDVRTPNLTITKEQRIDTAPTYTTNNLPYVIGDIISYRITVRNNGQATAYGTNVTDTINALLAYNPGSIITTLGSASVAGNILTWTIAQLGAQQSATLTFTVTTLPGAPASGRIPDQAIITTYNTNDNGFGISYGPVSSNIVNLVPPAVTINKSASITQGKIGDDFTYYLTVTVPAGTIAYSLTVTDTLPLGKQQYIGPAMLQEPPNPAIEVFPTVAGNVITFTDPTIDASGGARTFIYSFAARIIAGNHNPPSYQETQTDTGAVTWAIASGGATRTQTAAYTLTALTPHITLQKEQSTDGIHFTTNPITGSPGNTVYYRLTVQSDGASPAFSVNVSDLLDSNLTFGSIISQLGGGTVTPPPPGPGGTLTWNIPQLNNGLTAQLVFTVTINAGVGASAAISNFITAIYASNDPAHHPAIYDASSSPVIINIPALLLSKTVDHPIAAVGDTLTYTLTVTIPAGEAAYNLVVQDTFPVEQQYVSNSWTPALPAPIIAGNTIVWTDNQPSRLGPTTLTFQFQTKVTSGLFIAPYTQSQRNLTNVQWNITASGPPAPLISAFADVEVRVPHLSTGKMQRNVTAGMINFTPDPIPGVQVNDIIQYKITLTNDGTSTAYNVATQDQINALLSFVAFVPPLPPGTFTHSGGASDGTVNWMNLTLAPNETQSLIFSVRVLAGSPPGTTVTNFAATGYDTAAAGGTTLTATSNTTGFDFTLPVITKSVDKSTAVVGDTVMYTISLTIPNGNIAYNVQVTDILPPHQTYIPGSITLNGSPQPSSPTLNFDPLGTINAASGAVTNIYTFKATINSVAPPPVESQTNTATVNWAVNSGGTPGAPQSASATVTATDQTMQLSKSQRNTAIPGSPFVTTPLAVSVGDIIEYQITVTNPSATYPLYNVTVTDQLDPLLQFNTIVSPPPAGAIVSSSGTVIWDVPVIPPNTTYTAVIAVTVLPGGSSQGKIFNHLSAVYGVTTNPAILFGPVITPPIELDLPSLELLKSVDQSTVPLGTIITYTLVLTVPSGTKAYDVTVTDTLPPEQTYIGFATRNNVEVTPLQNGQVIIFQELDPVDATAGTVEITYTFQVRPVIGNSSPPYYMTQTNNVTAAWNLSPSGTPAIPISANTDITVTNPQVVLAKYQRNFTQGSGFTQGTISAAVGDTVRFKLEAASIGASTAYNVQVFDTLDLHQSFQGVISITSGTVTYDTATRLLTWTIPSIPPNPSAPEVLTFDVLIQGGVPAGRTTTNSASAKFSTNDTTPITLGPATSNPVTLRYPNIAINKLVNASNVAVGTTIVYTITATVPLGTIAYNLQVTDILDSDQSYVGPATLNGSTIIPIVNSQLITFPAITFVDATAGAKTFTYMFSVLVSTVDIDPATLTEEQSNTAMASWSYDGINPAPPVDSTVNVNVTDSSLSILKEQRNATKGGAFSTDTLFAAPGDTVEYRLTVTNTGPRTIFLVTVTDTLDPALTYAGTVLVPVGNITYSNGTVTWAVGTLVANSPVSAIFKVIYLQSLLASSPLVQTKPEIVLANQALATFQLVEQGGQVFHVPPSNIIFLSSWIDSCSECHFIIEDPEKRICFGLDSPNGPNNPIPDCVCHDICTEEVRFISSANATACIAFPGVNPCRLGGIQFPTLTPNNHCDVFVICAQEDITSHCTTITVRIGLLIVCMTSNGVPVPFVTTVVLAFPDTSFIPFPDCTTGPLNAVQFQEALEIIDGSCTVIQLNATTDTTGTQINVAGKVIEKLWKHENLWVVGLRPYDLIPNDVAINGFVSFTISQPLQPINSCIDLSCI
jgi:uncharacterized repeat protein (TIGR01451 family)/fimbrial isopeptide formation D2 family protein